VGFFSQALKDVLNRVQYGKPPITERQASFTGQLANFWQYYSWQFARDWGRVAGVATEVFTVLGLSGLVALWKSDRRAGLAGVALLGTLSLALVFYMNFKYGFSQYPDQPSLPREVRERDYFFVGSFAVFGAFVACGIGALMQSIVDGLRDRGTPATRWAAASPVLALALVPLLGNRVTASRAHETMARDFAWDILQSVEPYGILITAGDNDTFPLWYAQEVDGSDVKQIYEAIEKARENKGKPNVIILDTIKGKGCTFAEHELYNHHMSVSKEQMEEAINVLSAKIGKRVIE
jgi:hypothetical protein